MSTEHIDDLRKRALTTIWEIRTTDGNVLAEAIKPYRIRHIENMLAALKSRVEQPNASEEQRRAASDAIAEIQALFRHALDGSP
jgi:uncharacterized protein YicC (UPF0701 family)